MHHHTCAAAGAMTKVCAELCSNLYHLLHASPVITAASGDIMVQAQQVALYRCTAAASAATVNKVHIPVFDHGAHSAPTSTTFIAFGLSCFCSVCFGLDCCCCCSCCCGCACGGSGGRSCFFWFGRMERGELEEELEELEPKVTLLGVDCCCCCRSSSCCLTCCCCASA